MKSEQRVRPEPWAVSIVLGIVAIALLLNPMGFDSPVASSTEIPPDATVITPVRQPSLTPEYQVGVFHYRCSDCHNIIPSPIETDRQLTQHTDIHLDHGINTRCFNCHHPTHRDSFIDDHGGEIPWDEPQLLCARCHGPVYRDWQYGAHGRTNGYWNVSLGKQSRRKCIECHDPHHPPFQTLTPAPGPNALRAPSTDMDHHKEHVNPLHLSVTPSAGASEPNGDGH